MEDKNKDEKVKPLSQEERKETYQQRFERKKRVGHEEKVGIISYPISTHNAIQALKKHALPELDEENVNVIEVGVGNEGTGPYQFAHALEKEEKEYNITATDKNQNLLDNSKEIEQLPNRPETEGSWNRIEDRKEVLSKEELKDFKEQINYEKGNVDIPERWKENINFLESNLFYSEPKEQADIVNCNHLLYFYHDSHLETAFENLVDMVKPGGFLQADYLPSPDSTPSKATSEEKIKEEIDLEAHGLELMGVEKGHAVFRKKLEEDTPEL